MPHRRTLRWGAIGPMPGLALVLAATAAIALQPAGAALAHGDAHEGDLSIVVGFGVEPAYAGFPNSVQVVLEHDGDPVRAATDLTVEVAFGDATATFPLEPTPGEPGDYRAPFIPSEPGAYTFHVTGSAESETIDVEMTSGPDTFAEVQSTAEAAFPPVQAPGAEELAGRLETESDRITSAGEAAAAAADDAAAASTTATLALILAALGVIAAIGAIVVARRNAG
jgi:hypothetical protein